MAIMLKIREGIISIKNLVSRVLGLPFTKHLQT